jgi:hypothetical protein
MIATGIMMVKQGAGLRIVFLRGTAPNVKSSSFFFSNLLPVLEPEKNHTIFAAGITTSSNFNFVLIIARISK